ncbi:MAG: UrcA family protein [Hyphomonas sp.]|uniref:UrcA family protein n=1 Tax=Hyphomonas sp. TaxID=87 RepID=UPI0035276C3D
MMKSLLIGAALSAGLPLVAAAETLTPISVTVAYDKELLASNSGAEVVLDSMRKQARDACTTPRSLGRSPMVDKACVNDVMAKAATKILRKQEDEGLETAPAFAQAARLQTADLGQR